MKFLHLLLTSIIFLGSLLGYSRDIPEGNDNDNTEIIFTSKDKDFLQQWHYNQILQMDLNEAERDTYFGILNNYTYKMSRLGLSKYNLSSGEQKKEFKRLVGKLDQEMKIYLNDADYEIHYKTFHHILEIVFEKRNW